jgi:Fic family protein
MSISEFESVGEKMTKPDLKRQYQISHPWIKFVFDANDLDYHTWMLLGEAKSKCTHIAGAPLLPEVHKNLMNVYLVKGASATTAIEGNTLTEDEVNRRIKGELDLPPSKEYLGKEIDNIVDAINEIGLSILTGKSIEISIDDIKKYNSMVLDGLPLKEDVVPGKIRRHSVGVAGYRGAPAEDCEFLLDKYVHWLNAEFIPPGNQEMIFGKRYLHIYILFGYTPLVMGMEERPD